jgi:hypothetical protein
MTAALASISVQVDRAMKGPVSRHPSVVAPATKRKKHLTGCVSFAFDCVCNTIGPDYASSSDVSDLSARTWLCVFAKGETDNIPRRKLSINPSFSPLQLQLNDSAGWRGKDRGISQNIDDTVSIPKGIAVGATRMFDSFVPEWDLVFAHNTLHQGVTWIQGFGNRVKSLTTAMTYYRHTC